MAKGRYVRGPYRHSRSSSNSASSRQASRGRRAGLASRQPRANAAIRGRVAPVHQDQAVLGGVDHHVLGQDRAVDHPGAVRGAGRDQ